jgi:hypothetical protein
MVVFLMIISNFAVRISLLTIMADVAATFFKEKKHYQLRTLCTEYYQY